MEEDGVTAAGKKQCCGADEDAYLRRESCSTGLDRAALVEENILSALLVEAVTQHWHEKSCVSRGRRQISVPHDDSAIRQRHEQGLRVDCVCQTATNNTSLNQHYQQILSFVHSQVNLRFF